MIKIEISEQLSSKSELPDLLRYIAEQIDKGYTSSYNPTWKITEPVDSDRKTEKIDYIKRVIGDWGCVSTMDLELDSSPCIDSFGNIVQLIERLNNDGVEVVSYQDELELDTDYIYYEDLNEGIIDEIYIIIENYDAYNLRAEKRISD